MHAGSRLARRPSVAQCDIPGANVAISIRPPSGIVEPSSQRCAEPRLHRAKHTLRSRAPSSDTSCLLFSTKRALRSRAPFRKDDPYFLSLPCWRRISPSSSGPVQHLGNPATPLKPEIILRSPPPAPFLHPPSARDLQTPSAYPIWYPALRR